MSKKKQINLEHIRVDKLVHGGQGIGVVSKETADKAGRSQLAGSKIFVWNALPGELVDVRVTKKKSSYIESIATDIHEPSADRIEPEEPLSYLSTSPWQMMSWEAENTAKQAILTDVFDHEGIKNIAWGEFVTGASQNGYRNKMELGFWGDDDGLHLAHYVRGSHGKQKVERSVLATDHINNALVAARDALRKLDIWAGDLKTIMMRSSADGKVVAALFVKKELDFSELVVPDELQGMDIYFSNPQSPASVPTKLLQSYGSTELTDAINGKEITYSVLSFFQVNLPVFEQALDAMKQHIGDMQSIDMYSGVGTIGLAVESDTLVELDPDNIRMAKQNAQDDAQVIGSGAEDATDYISANKVLIVDPPRAGLHTTVIDAVLEKQPPKIIYLSCNPSTQARDVKLLNERYSVTSAQGYNFFPRTPHIESIVVLELK